jgi:formylglycine-generating enzyme required for sulfatase activity
MRWGILSVALVVVVTGIFTARLWFASFVDFLKSQTEILQALEAAVALVAVMGGGMLALFRHRKKLAEPTTKRKKQASQAAVEKNKPKSIKSKSTTDPAALRISYLNRLFEAARQLYLAGVDPKVASEAEARLNLEAVYTALLTQTPEAHERWQRGEMMEKDSRRLSALEQLNSHPRLVLLGDPGSGKSTFVNFVTLCLAGEALQRPEANLVLLTAPLPKDESRDEKGEHPQPWLHGALLPIRIILRDFAARGLPAAGEKAAAKHLWNFIVAELEACTLADFAPHLRDELLQKGGLLLFDGLDEVPEAHQRRVQIKQAVEDFSASHPKCRIVVTSRTYAYQKQDWRLPNFDEALLAPFSKGQIQRFIERWYGHIGPKRGMHADDAKGRAELLKRAIFGNVRLQALAERPLLLTLMASLHAWRGGSLPEKREELYNDTVDLLLDWWERPKMVRKASGEMEIAEPSLAQYLKVDRQKVRDLLNQLAFEAHHRQPELAGTADLAEEKLVGGLMRLRQSQEVNPAQLVDYLSQRAGLLIPRGVQIYTFPHRTFQEYLAACHLTDHDYPEKLVELFRSDPNRWREVLLLAGAKAARGAASTIWSLAEALCHRDVQPASALPTGRDCWAAHLAGQALVEIADLSQVSERNKAKVERVREWQTYILRREDFPAIERALAGNSLARLGDSRREVTTLDEMQFCLVPKGPFWMGSEEHDREKPQHLNEHLNYDYWISRYPITVAQYKIFVEASRHKPENPGSLRDLPNRPVRFVTWHEAIKFCNWLTQKWRNDNIIPHNWSVRLPSEAEWEKAARGGIEIPAEHVIKSMHEVRGKSPFRAINEPKMIQNRRLKQRYPWGDKPDSNYANYVDTGIGETSAVGCFPGGKSLYGCEEMSGNVWEWTRSLWGKSYSESEFRYPYKPNDGREKLDAPGEVLRVLRGGAFDSLDVGVRAASRLRNFPYHRHHFVGFRVAVLPLL